MTAKAPDELEYVRLNTTELWEVNYSRRSAVEVSEVVQEELCTDELSFTSN